jgi:hypothetical protein
MLAAAIVTGKVPSTPPFPLTVETSVLEGLECCMIGRPAPTNDPEDEELTKRCGNILDPVPADADAAPDPAASNRIEPSSLPYAGGGANDPDAGARPHFLTFASTKTNPDCPKLI